VAKTLEPPRERNDKLTECSTWCRDGTPRTRDRSAGEFREIAAAAAEAGTVQYRWFTSEDSSMFVVIEEYADEDAAFAHNRNCAALLERCAAIATVSKTSAADALLLLSACGKESLRARLRWSRDDRLGGHGVRERGDSEMWGSTPWCAISSTSARCSPMLASRS
jgi:quinol monooxygenase YgiN